MSGGRSARSVLGAVSIVGVLLLTGCMTTDGPGPGSFEQESGPASGSGLILRAPVTAPEIKPGDVRTWVFEVQNPADGAPVRINSACDGPFLVTLLGLEGDMLGHGGPAGAPCPDARLETFEPGAALQLEWLWDGRVSFDGGQREHDPIPGEYTIRIEFLGTLQGETGERVLAAGTTKVHVQNVGGGRGNGAPERVDGERIPGSWDTSGPDGSPILLEALRLHEELAPGAMQTWRFQARHVGGEGDGAIRYNAACDGPFRVTLIGVYGSELEHGGPGGAPCDAHQNATLAPGGILPFDWPWDGTFWTQGGDYVEEPTEGTYAVEIAFIGEDGGEPQELAFGETSVHVGHQPHVSPSTRDITCTEEGVVDLGVPEGSHVADLTALRLDDGSWRVYYGIGEQQIGSSTGTDGRTFTRDPGTRVSGNPDTFGAIQPRAVPLEDGRVRLYFSTGNHQPPTGLRSAISEDGLNFEVESGLRTLAENHSAPEEPGPEYGLTSPAWIREDGTYRFWYSGLGVPTPERTERTVYMSTSSDGLTWEGGEVVFGAKHRRDIAGSAEHPFVIAEDGGYTMAYVAPGTQTRPPGIYLARSTDGVTWTPDAFTGLDGGDPEIVVLSPTNWRIYYGGYDPEEERGYILSGVCEVSPLE